jgi:hypothetical protein
MGIVRAHGVNLGIDDYFDDASSAAARLWPEVAAVEVGLRRWWPPTKDAQEISDSMGYL